MPFGTDGIPAKVLELVDQAVIVTDVAGLVTYMNPSAERLYGWGPGEALGHDVLEVNVPEIQRERASQIMAELTAGRTWSGKFPVQRRDGTRFMASVTDTPVFDGQGRLRAIIGISRDVTEEERAAEAIQRSEARFRAIAQDAPVGIFETDADGRTVYLNGTGQEILGSVPTAGTGPRWYDSVHPEDRQRVQREWRQAEAAGEVFASEYRVLGPDGLATLTQVRATALRGPDGRVVGRVGVIVDLSRNGALRMQLALASRLASIGALVSGVAEQITPLATGRLPGQATALEAARLTRTRLQEGAPLDRNRELRVLDEVIQALEKAEEGGQRISRIVGEMRRVGRLTPGRVRVRLYDVVNQALHWLPEEVSRAAAIEIERRADPEVAVAAGQIEQLVVNLVTNAVKAAPKGPGAKVVVRIGSGAPGMVSLEVVDRGPGLDLAERDALLQPFFRKDAGEMDAGLGLVVGHVIVAAHGGTLSVSSQPSSGSTVRVELPEAGPTA